MATRAIVTSQPDVACDVCGRRLLRGEHPDTFLSGGGERRTVCELCAPRAAGEGWLRESEGRDLAMRPPRRRRGVSLLGRLRQLGEPSQTRAVGKLGRAGEPSDERWEHPFHEPPPEALDPQYEAPQPRLQAPELQAPERQPQAPEPASVAAADPSLAQAVEIFNAGEQPRRVAGVARSLGEPMVTVRPSSGSRSRVAIVIAWEICWYRYEVDLDERFGDARLVQKGMELDELAAEDREPNAVADERGELIVLA